ncbi:MAG TPA: hypothetical protein VE548_00730 [Nitrososphaeraceae archaeon]|nr:hypothetical protein [Nitrososphaeraceae archaeon]
MHIFQIAAFDRAGNTDPSAAELRWTVIRGAPAQAIETPIDHIKSISELSDLHKSALIARLNIALAYLTDRNPGNDMKGTCGQIDAFIQTVNSFATSNRISMLLASELTLTLPHSGHAIISELGCS